MALEKTKLTVAGAIGAAAATVVGYINPFESELILTDYHEVRSALQQTEVDAAVLKSYIDNRNLGKVEESIYELLESQLILEDKVLDLGITLIQSYNLDLTDVAPEPDPEEDFPTMSDVPTGVNPFQHFLEQARQAYATSPLPPEVVVKLPAGQYRGIYLKGPGWAGPPLHNPAWLGASTLVLRAPPEGADIVPNWDSGGNTFGVDPVDGWGSKVVFENFRFYGNGKNCFRAGRYCPDSFNPVNEVRFINCSFLDNPNGLSTLQPISVNQTGIILEDCFWNMPNSKEHGVYTRNGTFLVVRNSVIFMVGGQFFQTVNRIKESDPDKTCWGEYEALCIIQDNVLIRPHIDDSRAGSGITIAGGPANWVIKGNVIIDDGVGKNHNPGNGDTYGGIAIWSGGSDKTHPLPNGKFNGSFEIVDNSIFFRNPNRDILQISQASGGLVADNGFYCGPDQVRQVTIHNNAGPIEINGNQQMYHQQRILDVANTWGLNVEFSYLDDAILRYNSEIIGPLSGTYSLN